MPEQQDFASEPAQGTVPIDAAAMTARAQYFLDKAKATSDPAERATYARNALAALPQTVKLIDPDTGEIRDKTWWERNGDVTKFLISMAASFAGGYVASAANAGSAAGNLSNLGTSGVGLGETAAVSGLPAGSAGLPAGAFAGGVGPEVVGAGAFGYPSSGFDALSETQLNPGPAAATPTAGSANTPWDLTSLERPPDFTSMASPPPYGEVGPAVGGSSAAVAPAVAAVVPSVTPPTTPNMLTGDTIPDTGIGSGGVPNSLAPVTRGTSMVPWAEIAKYAIPAATSLYTSNSAANASQQASQQQQDAIKQALALQEKIYTQNRSDVQAQMQGLQPYKDVGPGALTNLQNLVANPYRGTSQTPQTGFSPQPFQPQQAQGGNLMTLGGTPGPSPWQPGSPTLPGAPGRPYVPGTPGTYQHGSPNDPNRGQGQVIQMRGPDGSVRPVLASEEQKWIGLGAARVS